MKNSFASFEQDYGGKVFVIYSVKEDINNNEVIEQIASEILRLNKIK